MKKILSILLLSTLVITLYAAPVFAGDDPMQWYDDNKNKKIQELENAKEQFGVVGVSVSDLILIAGNVIGFIMFTVHGIQKWLAKGDSTKKAKLKEGEFDLVTGAVYVFGGTWLYKLIYTIVQAFTS